MKVKLLLTCSVLLLFLFAYEIANAKQCKLGKLRGSWTSIKSGNTWTFTNARTTGLYTENGKISCIGCTDKIPLEYELDAKPSATSTIVIVKNTGVDYFRCNIYGDTLEIGTSVFRR